MKKTNYTYLITIIIMVFALSSCDGLSKMAERAKEVKHSVTPNPLELHAEKVAVKLTGSFPKSYFDKNALIVITPILKYGKEEKSLQSKTIQGESFQGNNDVIKFAEGGSFTMDEEIPYVDAMRDSELEIKIRITLAGKNHDLKPIKLADGVITTSKLVEDGLLIDSGNGTKVGKTIASTVTLESSSEGSLNAIIYYELQKSNVRSSQTSKPEVKKLVETVKTMSSDKTKVLSGVEIYSYASPDGPLEVNKDLVSKRGKSADTYLKRSLKGVDKVKDKDFLSRKSTSDEDWTGFKKELDASSLKDKELIARVLTMYEDPIVREREIKNISEAFESLKTTVLPKLRRSVMKISFKGKSKTDEEMKNLALSNPKSLSANELIHVTSLIDDLEKKATIYKSYTESFPNDWRGFNNLGDIYTKQNKLADAKQAFETANTKDANNGVILNNLGVIALANGNVEEAEKYFREAKNAGVTSDALGYNMGVINIMKAQYPEAVTNFGTSATFNKALAQLLNKETANAEATLNSMSGKDFGKFYYLKAIVASKLGKADEVFTNLKTAFEKDSELKKYAKKDWEFGKYFVNETFKTIVE